MFCHYLIIVHFYFMIKNKIVHERYYVKIKPEKIYKRTYQAIIGYKPYPLTDVKLL